MEPAPLPVGMTLMKGPVPAAASAPGLPQVLERIAGLIPEWYGPDASVLGTPRVVRRSWSIHLLPTVVSGDRTIGLVVKIPLWAEASDLAAALEAGPQEATLREFETLVGIASMVDASGDDGLAAIRPVAYVEDLNAVVTELLEARPLRRLAARGHRSQVTGVAPAVGRWLRRFHDEIGIPRNEPFDPATLETSLADLASAADGGPLVLKEGITSLRRVAASMAGRTLRMAVTHGDFGPSNVMVTPEARVAVIDPNLVFGPIEQDAAKLAVALRTGRGRLITGTRRRGPDRFERALLDGYGPVDAGLYRLCRGMAVAHRWVEIESMKRGPRRLALVPTRRVLAAELADSV